MSLNVMTGNLEDGEEVVVDNHNPEVDEDKRKEERKRRNRESAAKCRQKLKERLINCHKVVSREEFRNKALKNELLLLELELKNIMVIYRQHTNDCNLQNSSLFDRFNGLKANNNNNNNNNNYNHFQSIATNINNNTDLQNSSSVNNGLRNH